MKTHTLNYSCILNASVKEVCQFHTDTHNLPLITPPWIDVKIITMDEPMIEKSRVVLEIKRFGLPTRWEMEIETLQCPDTVVDSMVSGPFRLFRHERIFTAIDDSHTIMNETITLILPLGWIGNLVFPMIHKDMDKMFAYRHQATQKCFESNEHSKTV